MERIIVGRSATLTKTFTFTPTGNPTVTVVASDGTPVTIGSVTGSGTDWSYTIPSTSLTRLDRLTETWTATTAAVAQTFTDTIEVAGGSLFTLAELTALKPASMTWSTADMADMRTLVEQAFEDVAGVAFVPRFELETIGVDMAGPMLRLKWPKVTAVRSATSTLAGVTTTLTASDVIGLREGWAYYQPGWSYTYYQQGGSYYQGQNVQWYGNLPLVTIGYEHGHRSPPSRVARAALFEARYRMIASSSPTDDRMITQSYENGGTTVMQQPGRGGMNFYLPESDAAVAEYSLAVGIA